MTMLSRSRWALFAAAILCSSSTACAPSEADGSDAEETGADEAEIIGGTASTRRSVVVAVDENDEYLCTGVVIRPDAALLSFPCAAEAKAIYVGYSGSVLSDEPLGPKAGTATKIAVTGSEAITLQADRLTWVYVAHLATSTTAVATIAPALPAATTTCVATGYGALSSTQPYLVGPYPTGRRRNVQMQIDSSNGSVVHTHSLNGSIASADFDAFLFCGGRLVGPITTWDNAAANRYVFAALSSTTNACALGSGTGCVYDECTAGATQKTNAGCQSGERSRTCQANGRWGPYGATCS